VQIAQRPRGYDAPVDESADDLALLGDVAAQDLAQRTFSRPSRVATTFATAIVYARTCWESRATNCSVNRINCRMNATYVKSSCASDSECFEGDLCDGSTQCKCCVSSSSVPNAPSFPLYRYFALPLDADDTCPMPRDCIVDDAGAVSCQLSGEAWASAYLSEDAEDVNQRLCIVENLDRPCLWAVQITGGEVKLQSNGIPVVPDSKSYECGGNSCNGEGVFIVKPSAGYHPAMLFQDPCCKTCTPGISVACGDTCIPEGNNCDTPPGCAC
jgi:hypothetical protein